MTRNLAPTGKSPRATASRSASRPRRRKAMDRIGAALPPLIGKACRNQGFTQQSLITRWREIVGGDIADYALPIKLRRTRGRGCGAMLEVAAEGGYATQIKHIEPILVERINTYFGRRAVDRIAIVQRAMPARRRGLRRRHVSISEECAKMIKSATGDTRDPELREALQRLGEEMVTEKQGGETG